MKMLKVLAMASLMVSAMAAMADGGGDIVAAHMQAARDHAMAHYQQQEQKERQVATAHDQAKAQSETPSQKAGS